MAILNSPLCQLVSTTIWTEGIMRNVVRNGGPVTFVMDLHIDPSLFHQNLRYIANWRRIRTRDNHVFNYAVSGRLDDLPGPDMWYSVTWDHAHDASLDAGGTEGDMREKGLYLYRPYFVVDAQRYSAHFVQGTGLSQFGVSEEHYFWVEA